jgi:hypothetical protein
LGIAIIGGLIASQVLTLYATPVIYLWFDRWAISMRRWRTKAKPADGSPVEAGATEHTPHAIPAAD